MFQGNGYYWIDKRGAIHHKSSVVVDAIGAEVYFNSSNCIKHWRVKSFEDYMNVIEIVKKIIKVAPAKE